MSKFLFKKVNNLDSFTISDISRMSGIKAPTIRIWEQRYNALRPNRSEGNTRYYDGHQLRRLLNIVSLLEKGHKVSELSILSDEQLFDLLKKNFVVKEDASAEYFITQLIAAGTTYDEGGFEKIFSHCLLRFGLDDTYTEVLYPMLVRIGLMWASNALPPIEEHFISNLVKQKLYTAIDSLPVAGETEDTWLLMMPENEFHDIGLLFSQYLIRRAKKKVVYLGANVPLRSIVAGTGQLKPQNILLFFVNHDLSDSVQSYLKKLKSGLHGENIYIAGNQKLLDQVRLPKGVTRLTSAQSLQKVLDENNV